MIKKKTTSRKNDIILHIYIVLQIICVYNFLSASKKKRVLSESLAWVIYIFTKRELPLVRVDVKFYFFIYIYIYAYFINSNPLNAPFDVSHFNTA